MWAKPLKPSNAPWSLHQHRLMPLPPPLLLVTTKRQHKRFPRRPSAASESFWRRAAAIATPGPLHRRRLPQQRYAAHGGQRPRPWTLAGAPQSAAFGIPRRWDPFRRSGQRSSPGTASTPRQPDMVGTFRTPTLRHLEHTSPYMHDGSMGSLEEVVRHYNRRRRLCSIIMVRHCSSRSVSTRHPNWTWWPSCASLSGQIDR